MSKVFIPFNSLMKISYANASACMKLYTLMSRKWQSERQVLGETILRTLVEHQKVHLKMGLEMCAYHSGNRDILNSTTF